MKKIRLTAVLFFFILAASAQEKMDEIMRETTPGQRAATQTSHMKETLALTDDQALKAQDINLKYAHKMQNAYNTSGRKFQKLKQMKNISHQKDDEMKRLLSKEQYEIYEKNRDAMRESAKAKIKEN